MEIANEAPEQQANVANEVEEQLVNIANGNQEQPANIANEDRAQENNSTAAKVKECLLDAIIPTWHAVNVLGVLTGVALLAHFFKGNYCDAWAARFLLAYLVGWNMHIVTNYFLIGRAIRFREGLQPTLTIVLGVYIGMIFATSCANRCGTCKAQDPLDQSTF